MNLVTPKTHQSHAISIPKGNTTFFYFLFLLFFSLNPFSKIIGQNAALNFDGTDDYLVSNVNELPSGNATHTIESWVYIESLPTTRTWLFNLGQYNTGAHHWLLEANGDLTVGVFNGPQIVTSFTSCLDFCWIHLATVFDGTTLSLYLDGNLVDQKAVTFNFTDKGLNIGRLFFSNETHFDGSMDEIRIWNTARSSSQISDNRYQALNGDESGLIAYYNFNEGTINGTNSSITTIPDISGKGNNCTINNFAKTGTSSNWVSGPTIANACALIGNSCNDNNPNTINDKYDRQCNCRGELEYCWTIQSSEEDGSASSDYPNSTTRTTVLDYEFTSLNFSGVDIPKGAIIKEAYLQFTASKVTIDGYNEDYFSVGTYENSAAPTTGLPNNYFTMTIPEIILKEETFRSPNLANSLQYIINYDDWTGSSYFPYQIENLYGDFGSVSAYSYDGDPAKAPQLCVTYTTCDLTDTYCDDGNSNTYNDKYNGDCNCVGEPIQTSCNFYCGNNEDLIGYLENDLGETYNVWFEVLNSLCCKGTFFTDLNSCVEEGKTRGEVHITNDQYIADDWYNAYQTIVCNNNGTATVRRGSRNFQTGSTARYQNNNYSLFFSEPWTLETDCAGNVDITVYVYQTAEEISLDANPIASGIYESNSIINSTGKITGNSIVEFVAGTAVILEEGFTVNSGATFTARIEEEALLACADIQFDPLNPPVSNISADRNNSTEETNNLTMLALNKLMVYPNPFENTATIDYFLGHPSPVEISLLSINGQRLQTIEKKKEVNAGNYQIDFKSKNLSKGLYLLKLQTTSEVITKKIIIQ